VNPEHLFLGTQAQNIKDMVKKGRHGKHRTKTVSPGPDAIDDSEDILQEDESSEADDIEEMDEEDDD